MPKINKDPTPKRKKQTRKKTARMSGTSYAAGINGAVKRIRTPASSDVLSGRGGSINAHVGNIQFRRWVAERKNDYNLAATKVEKSVVAQEVIALVRSQSPPGRFLQKDPTAIGGIGWWVEIEEEKTIAKTSQALREGAPKIREAYRIEKGTKRTKPFRTPPLSGSEKSTKNVSLDQLVPSTSITGGIKHPVVPIQPPQAQKYAHVSHPLPPSTVISSGQAFQQQTQIDGPTNVLDPQPLQVQKHARVDCPLPPSTVNSSGQASQLHSYVDGSLKVLDFNSSLQRQQPLGDGTPPLSPAAKPSHVSTEQIERPPATGEFSRFPTPARRPFSEGGDITRYPSFGLSEVGEEGWGDLDFVNPFENEDELELFEGSRPPLQPGMLRESRNFSISSNGDMGGIGALFRGDSLAKSVSTNERVRQ